MTSDSDDKGKKDNKEKYTLLKNASKSDVCTFVANRLDLKFIETDPYQFLSQLYEECGRRHLLKTVNTQFKAKVFISYSHKDIAIVDRIENELLSADIEVIRDIKSMHGGQKISDFIDVINNVDCVISVLSEHSLFSTWVCKEIVATLKNTSKYYLPCNIDDAVSDTQLVARANELVKEKMDEISQHISSRGDNDISDLIYKREAWTEYKSNMPFIAEVLNGRKHISLKAGDFDRNIEKVIADIINHVQHA